MGRGRGGGGRKEEGASSGSRGMAAPTVEKKLLVIGGELPGVFGL